MKLQDLAFNVNLRKDTDFMDFYSTVQNILNLSRYQMRIVTAVPTWAGEGGEHLLYISGNVRRFYWYDDVNSTWQYIEWNGSGELTPCVVANVALTEQTASISATTIYTPAVAGLYRVAVHTLVTTAGSSGTLDATIHWTNDIGATSVDPPAQIALTAAGNWGSGIIPFRSTATAIQYSTTVAGEGGSPKYAIWISLERLL